MISFNSSSPRFQNNNLTQVRIVPNADTLAGGVNLRMNQDVPLGPWSYSSPDEIERLQK